MGGERAEIHQMMTDCIFSRLLPSLLLIEETDAIPFMAGLKTTGPTCWDEKYPGLAAGINFLLGWLVFVPGSWLRST